VSTKLDIYVFISAVCTTKDCVMAGEHIIQRTLNKDIYVHCRQLDTLETGGNAYNVCVHTAISCM